MQKHELTVQPQISRRQLERVLGNWAKRQDAEVRPMGRLARRYKTEGENLHWHISGPRKGMGTVEVTYFPSNGMLTVLVRDNRCGSWAGSAYEDLAREVGKLLGTIPPQPFRST